MQFKNIIKPIAFLTGLLLLLNALSYLFIPKDKAEEVSYKRFKGILCEPKNTIDYLAIGDSECDSSISPMEIWKKYGYTGYNCGVPGQQLRDTYYMLKELLQNQSPKVVLLETNEFYRNYGFYKKYQTIVDGFAKKIFPIYEYHNRWKNFNFDMMRIINTKPEYTWTNPLKGLHYNVTVAPYRKGAYIKKTEKTATIHKLPLLYLNKIVDLCNEYNIQLILYCVPSPLCWTYPKHNSTATFAEKNGLSFIDLNLYTDELGIDWSRDTYDKGNHLNYYGAKKVTSYIGAYLSEYSNLKDHRKEERYAFWNQSVNEYFKLINYGY
jgi:hypothetical protein